MEMEWVRREKIGHGSFSTVSLASPIRTSAAFPPLMAVKSTGDVCSAALRNEKQVLDELGDDCPQIVRCFGDGWTVENGERIYNVFLEYASGGSLAGRIGIGTGGAALPESEVRLFTRSILKGLLHIHAKGFSHCDIKLENILVFGNGDVKISDFGLAKKMRNIIDETEESRVEIRGTPLYMAPESVNDSNFESPADIWALGCCVVEMASGKTAWCLNEGTNVMSLLVRIGIGDEFPRIPAELTDEGKDFLSKCFVKNPRERWTAQMLLDHPYLAVDEQSSTAGQQMSCDDQEGAEVSVSPRSPFDFPDWVSVQSPVSKSGPVYWSVNYSRFGSPEERIGGFVSDEAPDWSLLPDSDWVTVR